MSELCHILFYNRGGSEPVDKTGCLKPNGHHDHHVFKDEDGQFIAWEFDDECNCGCVDGDDLAQCCAHYWTVNSVGAK